MKVTELPTPTGLGFTAGFDGNGLGHPLPVQVKVSPLVFGPILVINVSLPPDKPVCIAVIAGMLGSVAVGKFPDAVSPAI